MRLLLSALIAGVFVISAPVFAAPLQTSPWSLISVPRTATILHFLDLLPVMAEGGTRERIHAEAKAEEIQTLREWGVDVEILVSDIQQLRPFAVGNSFPWLMSSWETYHDSYQIEVSLRLLVEQFPQVSRLIQIGTSVQGRPIFGVLLSDTPWAREYDEPALRVIGGHHGDEWAATEIILATAWHFAEGYETNSSIRDLLDATELWIIPALNPDGMTEFTRNNANNVDLNRNYSVGWRNRTYSGTAPFSEPETAAIRAWGMARVFYHSLSAHSGAANIGWVWNHTTDRCPDDEWMEMVSTNYLESTTYPDFWITNGADWYVVYGDTNDWSYGARGGHDYTLELCEDKTPPESELQSLVEHHLPAVEAFFTVDGSKGVRGRVVDEMGNGIEAKITLNGELNNSYSDFETGAYHRLLPEGSHLLMAEAPGFGPQSFLCEVNSQGLTSHTFTLTTSALLDGFPVMGRDQLSDHPGDVTICGVEGEVLSWAVYRASLGLVEMGELTKEESCWIGQWQPQLIPNAWDREGEWTILISNNTAQVVARSASGLISAASLGNPNWELHVETLDDIPDGLLVESAQSLRRIIIKGATVPLGGMLRLVHREGHRIFPLFFDVDEEGNSIWLVDISTMEEGWWSIRFLGAGRWTSLPNALVVHEGELEIQTSPSRPEIDLELEFMSSDSEVQENPSIAEDQGCDCSGFPPSGIGWFVILWVGVRRRRRIIQ